MKQNENNPLKSYLSIAYGQLLKYQKNYEIKINQYDIRSLSYHILKELILEQVQNENSHTTTR